MKTLGVFTNQVVMKTVLTENAFESRGHGVEILQLISLKRVHAGPEPQVLGQPSFLENASLVGPPEGTWAPPGLHVSV